MKAFITKNTITVKDSKTNKIYKIGSDHPNFSEVEKLVKLNKDEDKIIRLVSVKNSIIEIFSNGKFKIIDDEKITYNDKPISGKVVDLIISLKQKGYKFEHLINFIENSCKNPDNISLDGLFNFIKNSKFVITGDGCFIGYKYINSDFTDGYTGKFDNSVGKTVTMPRKHCCKDPKIACSTGLHVATYSYATKYKNSNQIVVLVKVNPQDVVSVPNDYNFSKMRCCKYTVIANWTGKNEFEEGLLDENLNFKPVEFQNVKEEISESKKSMKWLDYEIKYLIENHDKSIKSISENINRTENAISKKLRQLIKENKIKKGVVYNEEKKDPNKSLMKYVVKRCPKCNSFVSKIAEVCKKCNTVLIEKTNKVKNKSVKEKSKTIKIKKNVKKTSKKSSN